LNSKFGTKLFGWLAGATLTVLVGEILLQPVGDGLARLSYDVPFIWTRQIVPNELVMVYLDSQIEVRLGQSTTAPLPRRFYTELLQRLTIDGARLVIFDILFRDPSPNPATDDEFAKAIQANGRVVLAGDYGTEMSGNAFTQSSIPPLPKLAAAAQGWGDANYPYDPADYGIRNLYPGTNDYPSVGMVAATLLEAPVARKPGLFTTARWLNYYCAPLLLRSVNLDQALPADGLPKGYFHDKIVVVGARPGAGLPGAAREAFRNPWSIVGGADTPGPALQGLTLLNLLHGDWLTRLTSMQESLVVLLWGIIVSGLLLTLRPWVAMGASLLCLVLFTLLAMFIQVHRHLWLAWVVPAGVQTSVALLWSVGFQYLVAARGRRKLRRAFGVYLSPYMADQIADQGFDLNLGGKEVEATVMFTDLQGFTKMSENLAPAEVSRILTTYFNQTTRAILEQDGTIIKYIGDAVMAVWGAPLPEPRHAERAVLAAWGMSQAGQREIAGRRLRTRIGVNTGMVLAGNLGSEFRFDYTLIGDTTNFASRLEGLNKYLGTEILVSEFTRLQAGNGIKFRSLGHFRVAGKSKPAGICEVIGPAKDYQTDPPWLAVFARALDCFTRGEFQEAEQLLHQVIALRGGKDGPSEFYLEQILHARKNVPASKAWDGTIQLDSK
jgi:adenylate cyclase